MIGKQTHFLRRQLQQQAKYGAMIQSANRGFAGGGPKKKAMDPKETDFDIVFVGGLNSAALLKFTQQHDMGSDLKMAIVSENTTFIQPQAYFGVVNSAIKELKLESGTLAAQVETWSRVEGMAKVSKINPNENHLHLNNGKKFTYKALVLNTGFEHSASGIVGLDEFANGPEENNVFVHMLDHKATVARNFYSGWNNAGGDMICYSPKFPYKGEGTDFYALYYEHFMRQDKLQGRSSAGARIQYWTPNKEIYRFPYANEVAMDECHKRGIDVMLGWEMLEVKTNQHGQKIAVFKNVDSGETIEKDFNSACINPPSKTHDFLAEAGLTDAAGLVDVNRYTLQHNKHENIFAFGDCISGDTTRTHVAAMAQNPIVKNNVLNYVHGKDCNAIYDGYTFMPFYVGHSYASNFQHLHDFEPAPMNHWVPQYGVFARAYFGRMLKSQQGQGEKYGNFKKTHGPPHYSYAATYDDLEHNEILQKHGVAPEEVRHPSAQARINVTAAQE